MFDVKLAGNLTRTVFSEFNLPVIDFEKQKEIKDYIDDLVFGLYFNVNIRVVGLDKASQIKAACSANKYYKVVNQEKA